MSELPPGSMNLEDDAPPEPVSVTPPAADPVTPPADPPDAPPEPAAEVDAVEVAGRKYVPVQAVIAERKQRQELKAIADRVPQLEADNAAMRPYIEFLKANPDLMKPRQQEAPPPPPPSADPDVVEHTQLMDFYKSDGTPDYDRGAKHLALMDRRNQRQNAEAVRPFREATLQERSTQNFAKALAVKDPSGQSPSPEALKAVWSTLSVEDTANSEIAATLAMLAMGADRMMGRNGKPAAAPTLPPPLVTEASGGHPASQVRMSRIEETIAANRGVSATKWQEATAGFQKGRANVLED